MSKSQEKYLEEFEKYKNIKLEVGILNYVLVKGDIKKEVSIIEIDEQNDKVTICVGTSSYRQTKTLHWCRKYLKKI